MKKTYVTAIRLMVCALLGGLFLTTQVHAQKLVTYRFGTTIPEVCDDALANLTATTTADGVTATYFTLSTVDPVNPYDPDAIIFACTLGEFLSFTGDSAESPACNSEPWQPIACGPEYCEDGQVPDDDPLLGGWPCCDYQKAWQYEICASDSNNQLVINGLVFDSRRLAPGPNGKKTIDMPGATHYRIVVNGEIQGDPRYPLALDNDWHNIVHEFSSPLVLDSGDCAEIKMLAIGAQLDDPIPWRIDNVQLLGVATSDETHPDGAFTLTAEMAKTRNPKVDLKWTAPPLWTGTSGEILINRNGVEIAVLGENTTTYTDDAIPGTGEDEEQVDVGIYEVCTSYNSGKTLCSNLATVKY
jgi:hypothetical protein